MSDCIFCKIINKEIPANVVYEDDIILAFHDLEAVAPQHVLIIPKVHIDNMNGITEESGAIIAHIFTKVKDVAKQLGISDSGYRIVSNCGVEGGQTVGHLHFHLAGGRQMQWPPG